MNKRQFEEALERGSSGKLGSIMNMDHGVDYRLMIDKTMNEISMMIAAGGMLHGLMLCSRGWGTNRAVTSMIKREDTWELSKSEFVYSALFDYRCVSGDAIPDLDEEGSMSLIDIDFPEWYDRYVGELSSSPILSVVRLTVRGNYSNIPRGVVDVVAGRNFYGAYTKVQGVPLVRINPAHTDCQNAKSYRVHAWYGMCSVEFLEEGVLRTSSNKAITPPIEESYTGWMPSDLGEEIISEEKTGEFSVFKTPGSPVAMMGKTIYSKTKDNLLQVTIPIEIAFNGTIYSIPNGVYFLGRKSQWVDSIDYDNWLSLLSHSISLNLSTKKSHLLVSLGENSEGSANKTINRSIMSIGETETGPTASKGSGSKITKM
jgi:hypothetical protein